MLHSFKFAKSYFCHMPKTKCSSCVPMGTLWRCVYAPVNQQCIVIVTTWHVLKNNISAIKLWHLMKFDWKIWGTIGLIELYDWIVHMVCSGWICIGTFKPAYYISNWWQFDIKACLYEMLFCKWKHEGYILNLLFDSSVDCGIITFISCRAGTHHILFNYVLQVPIMYCIFNCFIHE